MSPSVLGKRTRSQTSLPVLDTKDGVQTRAKRRSVLVLGNDENDNPFFKPNSSPAPRSKTESRPSKHGLPQSRVTPSPNKISAHFSVTKTAKQSGVKSSPLATPQTPRHRDALASKVTITPRHRVLVSSTPSTPRTPSTPSNAINNVYNQARQIFSRCTDPGVLLGREEEKSQLTTFISERLQTGSGGCLYISGPPGTGKSAFVGTVCEELKLTHDIRMSTVNCMSVKTAKDLANTLSKDLNLNALSGRAADFDFLRANFFDHEDDNSKKYLVVLDEIDRLVDLDLKLLYSLFEWSMEPTSRLILIGIANALDLTDRFLPRLKSRNLKPNLLPFMPYTAPQISNIITSKLKALRAESTMADSNYVPFLHPAAILFCSKKVASQTGDLRKAFDICKRAVDMIESETKVEHARIRLQESPSKTALTENINLASPIPVKKNLLKDPRQTTLVSSISHLTLESAPRATIAHVAKVTATIFSNGASQRLSTLNLQQKAVLCTLSYLERKKLQQQSLATAPSTPSKTSHEAPTIRQLYETYSSLCKRENLLHPLTSLEFRDVVGGLETLSLVSAVEAKGASSFSVPLTPSRTPSRRGKTAFVGAATGDDKRMAACVGHVELLSALKGPGSDILKDMIEGDGVVA